MSFPGPVRVVMATCNGARWLRPQLMSIGAQTVPPDEILVFDDCSSDGTDQVVGEFASAFHGIVRFERRAQPLGAAANFLRGIQSVPDGIVVLSDQDDIWEPERVERSVAHLESAVAVFSDGTVIDGDGRPTGGTVWGRLGFSDRRRQLWARDPLAVLLQGNVVTGATLAFRRTALGRFARLPATGWHDFALAVLLTCAGTVIAAPESLVRYRLHGTNAVGLPEERLRRQRRSRSRSLTSLRVAEAQLDELRDVLASSGCGDAADRLSAKMRHLEARRNLPAGRVSRVPTIVRELRAREYHRFGRGFLSALQDLTAS